jgi:hypothetical protein
MLVSLVAVSRQAAILHLMTSAHRSEPWSWRRERGGSLRAA